MKRFYGRYDTIPLEDDPDTYKYQRDFGFLRDDGIMVISPEGTTTDGASIRPKILWIPLGSPLEGGNKYWASPHDGLYRKFAIIMDTTRIGATTPLQMFHKWRELDSHFFIHQTTKNKAWADDTLRQAMKAWGEPAWKRSMVYRGVRIFGRNNGWWHQ